MYLEKKRKQKVFRKAIQNVDSELSDNDYQRVTFLFHLKKGNILNFTFSFNLVPL